MILNNPIIRRELLTFLRGKKAMGLFVIYLVVLASAIYVGWPLEKSVGRSEATILSKSIFLIYGAVSMALIVLFVPSLSAGAITMEREMGVIDLLRTSPLTTASIIWGKLLSALIYIIVLLIASLPVVSLCLLLGAIALSDIIGLYILLFTIACLLGMIGLASSAFFHRSQGSYVTTYMVTLPIGAYFMGRLYSQGFFGPGEAIVYTVLIAFLLPVLYAFAKSRFEAVDAEYPVVNEEKAQQQAGLILNRELIPDRWILPARVFDPIQENKDIILDKEFRCEIYGRGTLFIRFLLQGGLIFSLFAIAAEVGLRPDEADRSTGHIAYHGGIYISYLMLISSLTIPALACNSVTQEWERGTLELLLTTPLTMLSILKGKLLANLRLSLGLNAIFLLPHLPLLLLNPTMWKHPLVFAAEAMIMVLSLSLFLLLSLFFGILYQTTVRAMGATYLTVFVLFILPFLVVVTRFTYANYAVEGIPWYLALSPFVSLFALTRAIPISMGDFPVDASFFGVLFLAVVCGVLFAALFGGGTALMRRQRVRAG